MQNLRHTGWTQIQNNINRSKAEALAAIADPSKVDQLGSTALGIYKYQLELRCKQRHKPTNTQLTH